jgi:pimeloyl-ACP methyl ester carboxylesterase
VPSVTVKLPDGRTLEALSEGSADGPLLLFQTGTPTAAVEYRPLAEVAAMRGLRTLVYSRPGYAGSTPRPGRSVADAVDDIDALLDLLEAETFVTIGWSGGGPHALACAALRPDRCAAAATIAGVAPYAADGLKWLDGMGPENVEEFSRARQGESALSPWLDCEAAKLATVTGGDVAAALGGLVSEVDRAALTGEFADYMASCFRRAVSMGIAGWRDDDLAFTREWGFDVTRIERPVAVWQGGEDRMVPFAHGQWLVEHIPGAHPHLDLHEGHLSLAVGALDQIVDEVLKLAVSR